MAKAEQRVPTAMRLWRQKPKPEDAVPPLISPDDRETWDAGAQSLSPTERRSRREIVRLARPNGYAVELGVARGNFSELLLKPGRLDFLYSVDSYDLKNHRIDQYQYAVARLAPFRKCNTVLRMRFVEALPLFPDGYFDLIYIDGFAKGGQENGQTIRDWFPKVSAGGILAGHDYDPHWPNTVTAVDQFSAEYGLPVHTIGGVEEPDDPANRYTSWYVIKPQ